jgi:peptide/nickel transport system ATP-binding protein
VNALLKVTDLHVHFATPVGVVRANNGVNLEVREGESLGIMGESGCGKTVLFLSLLHLQQPGQIMQGRIELDGRDITALDEHEMEHVRGRVIALVPQNQATALNPAYTVRRQLAEALAVRRRGGGVWQPGRPVPGEERSDADEITEVFSGLGFEAGPVLDRLLRSYPHQLSGGMRQRVLIAMALLMRPRLLIADEPTTALDRAVKAQALESLQRLRGALTMLVISHDVEAIAATCDRVAIMYGGRVIESGRCAEVLSQPRHPYSRLLLAAQQRTRGEPLAPIAAETLDLIHFPPGCPFHVFCSEVTSACATAPPPEYVTSGAMVACHLYGTGAA